MALCMVCMTVAVASAANSSPKGASITGATGAAPLAVTDIGDTKVNSGDNVTAFKFTALTEETKLTVEMPAVMSNATLSVYCLVPNSGPAAFFDAAHKWVAATNVSLNGTTLTFTAPAGAVAVAVVENAGGSSAGTTAGASGADVTAPKTNDVPVELILGLGVVMFAGVAVACKRRAA